MDPAGPSRCLGPEPLPPGLALSQSPRSSAPPPPLLRIWRARLVRRLSSASWCLHAFQRRVGNVDSAKKHQTGITQGHRRRPSPSFEPTQPRRRMCQRRRGMRASGAKCDVCEKLSTAGPARRQLCVLYSYRGRPLSCLMRSARPARGPSDFRVWPDGRLTDGVQPDQWHARAAVLAARSGAAVCSLANQTRVRCGKRGARARARPVRPASSASRQRSRSRELVLGEAAERQRARCRGCCERAAARLPIYGACLAGLTAAR